jgi:hypothetical protein
MNIERGIKRILAVLAGPLASIGTFLMLYGYGRAYLVNRTLDKKIAAYLNGLPDKFPSKSYVVDQHVDGKDSDKPRFNPSIPYQVLDDNGNVLRTEVQSPDGKQKYFTKHYDPSLKPWE